ncbi:NAD-dependent epimerase/dehydratase family protein [Clostridium polynesiense]|uniref:NAD-dependent epimerase/dehydratase family protein n=1 Tax=Clostridium polynesiense TaxID=1325933 RepID=UPI00058CDD96|nr:NAD(P)-dependent oxidoreductase [Clostridium polynesiense]
MKVSVTGANGLVGQNVIKHLMKSGYEVTALTRNFWKGCPTEQINVDIRNYDEVFNAIKGCDAVIHLAAIPQPDKEDNDPRVFQNNVMGVYNILMAAGIQGIKKVAIASSDCALGVTFAHKPVVPQYIPVDEEHPATPDNSYGISKIVGEQIADSFAHRFPDMTISSLRITYVADVKKVKNDMNFAQDEDVDFYVWNLWSYIDKEDCARAFRLAIEADFKGHEVFYIAAPNTRCLTPSIDLINKYMPNAEVRGTFMDHEGFESTEKAERFLGFKAENIWEVNNDIDQKETGIEKILGY